MNVFFVILAMFYVFVFYNRKVKLYLDGVNFNIFLLKNLANGSEKRLFLKFVAHALQTLIREISVYFFVELS